MITINLMLIPILVRFQILDISGVYTKNRNFRLYLSSKLRKNNPLVLSEDNKYVPQRVETTNRKSPSQEKLIFMDSLIANVK